MRTLFDCYYHYLNHDQMATRGRKIYTDQVARVRNLTRNYPKGQYLEFDVKQGWSPLCEFLGKAIPRKGDSEGGKEGEVMPFPHVMDREMFEEVSKMVRFGEIMMTVEHVGKWLGGMALVGGGWWLGRGRVW
jgi:hypothetical protein